MLDVNTNSQCTSDGERREEKIEEREEIDRERKKEKEGSSDWHRALKSRKYRTLRVCIGWSARD